MEDQERPAPPPLSPEMIEYRRTVQAAEDASHADFDKAVLALSGGALGITFTFFKDVVKPGGGYPTLLIMAWMLWCASLAAILVSFYTAGQANRQAIRQIDNNTLPHCPGGWFDRVTRWLNFCGGACFLIGLVLAICFTCETLASHEQRPSSSTPAAAASSAASPAGASPTAAATTAGPK